MFGLPSLASTPVRFLTVAYVLALTLIGLLSLGAHFIVERVVNESEYSASTINIAGKQRMLSQRTAYFLVKANQTKTPADIGEFKAALDEFAKNHDGLINGSEELKLPGDNPETVKQIYFNGENALDARVKSHIDALAEFYARLVAGETIAVQEIQPFLQNAETTLLASLNDVVEAHEAHADSNIDYLLTIQWISISIILVVLLSEALMIFRPLVNRVKKQIEQLKHAAHHDTLTGVFNRRAFYSHAEREMSRTRRHSLKLSMMICDLDKFKSINDTHGHDAGDKVLKHFAKIVPDMLRKEDVFARLGGEEFAIFLPETGRNEACQVAERICELVRNSACEIADGETISYTTSIGVSDVYGSGRNQTVDDVLLRADEAVYKAKKNGRDRYETIDALFAKKDRVARVA